GESAALAIVGAHGGHARHRTMHHHHREALFDGSFELWQDWTQFVAEAVDGAGQLLRAHQLEVRDFASRVIFAIAQHEGVPTLPDTVLGAQRKRRKIRVGDIRNDQAEGERSAPDETLRHAVGPVAEPGDDVLHPLTRRPTSPALARPDT